MDLYGRCIDSLSDYLRTRKYFQKLRDKMDLNYNKRRGTSGITGQFYETKLIGLLLFRLTKDEAVEEFYLASNMADVGDFDDICVKVKLKGRDRHVLLFIQAKHKESDKGHLVVCDEDLFKWATSIHKIHDKFTTKKEMFFSSDLNDTDYFLILYTNAVYKFRKSVDSIKIESTHKLAKELNGWLSTDDKIGALPNYTSEDEGYIGTRLLEDELKILAERFAMFLHKTDLSNIMNDNFIFKYHVVLAQKVVKLSNVQSKKESPDSYWRSMTFRNEFFTTTDENIAFFREHLYSVILKHREADGKNQNQSSISSEQSKLTVTLISMGIKYNNGRYVFNKHMSSELTNVEIRDMLAMAMLIPLEAKVPLTFGNVDLVVRDDDRITFLANYVNDLCKRGSIVSGEIITETINHSMLKLNGGLGSAIGNILDYDKKTKQLRFSDTNTITRGNAKALLLRLDATVKENLNKYRFPIQTAKLPTLSLDCTDVAKDFFDKFVIYSQQSNHVKIQDILEKYIQNSQTNTQSPTYNSETVFQSYHSLIQTWWMSKKGQYLTKSSDICQQAIVALESQMFTLQNIFFTSKSKYFNLIFLGRATQLLEAFIDSLEKKSNSVIATESTSLTLNKVIQCLETNYAIIDLETYCTLSLTIDRYSVLNAELKNTQKTIVVMCDCLHNIVDSDVLLNLAKTTEQEKVIFIVNNELLVKLQQKIPKINNIFHDEPRLSELTSNSQGYVIDNANIIFQGEKSSLSFLIKHEFIPLEYIKGAIFDKIVDEKNINVGQPVKDAKYDKMKHLYIDRVISKVRSDKSDEEDSEITDTDENGANKKKKKYLLRDLTDMPQSVVLIIAKPGMGKSTLLTHLSLKHSYGNSDRIKRPYASGDPCHFNRYKKDTVQKLERGPYFYWIVRINLLDFSNVFDKWQKNNTVPKGLETLEFLCHVVLNNHDKPIVLEQVNDQVYLTNDKGDWSTFELNVFLNFYNMGKVVFLFDGFDEICPGYKQNVINFFDGIKSHVRHNKLWLTSRPYSDLLPDLIKVFGEPFKLEHITYDEQKYYLDKFWTDNINFTKLTDDQVKKTIDVMSDYYINSKCFYIFNSFLMYLNQHISQSNKKVSNESNLIERDQAEELTGTPLILYLTASYCVNIINDTSHTKINQSSFSDINIYEMFIETKLKNILYEDKDKTDLTIQSNLTKYESDRKKCIKRHKIMGAFAILGNPIGSRQETYFEEFKDLKPIKDENKLIKYNAMITSIKKGEEKTGLITHVTSDDIPVFIHRTFAEYFAAEFICDIFNSGTIELGIKRLLYTTVTETPSYGVKHWILKKTEGSPSFNNVTKEYIPFVYQGPLRNMLPKEVFIRLLSATPEDFEREYYNEATTNNFAKNVLFSKEDEDEINKYIRITIDGIVATMKPHLKEHFINY